MRYILIGLILLILSSSSIAQQGNYPLSRDFNRLINKHLNQLEEPVHTGLKPLLKSQLNQHANFDSLVYRDDLKGDFYETHKGSWFWRKLLYEDFITVNTPDFKLAINPLFDLAKGKHLGGDSKLLVNTRGIEAKGDIGNKVSFYTSFHENQAYFIDYISEYAMAQKTLPGYGRIRGFKEGGYDYALSTGYVSYSPSQHFNFQLGHGKQFIGEGYRSLLLSDHSSSYPYLKATATFNKLQYTTIYTTFQEVINVDAEARKLVYKRKHGSFNFLNWVINKNVQVGFFEAIMWQTADSTQNNHFEPSFFNPVMMIRPFQYGMNDKHNVLLGFNTKIKVTDHLQAYGQFVLDDLDLKESNGYFGNKYGYQFGIKYFDLLPNLYLQAEYNRVRPYTYSHDLPVQNYSSFNQPLAHPLGANFKETVGIVHYSYKKLFAEVKFNYAVTGVDTGSSHYGTNIFLSQTDATTGVGSFNNEIGQGIKTTITNQAFRLGYLINPRTNMHLYLEVFNRKLQNDFESKNSQYVMFGIKTAINNFYHDF